MSDIPDLGVIYEGNGVFKGMDSTQMLEMDHYLEKGVTYRIKPVRSKPKMLRTIIQNSSMHLYFRNVSKALNDAGYDMMKFFTPGAEVPWDKDGKNFKELVWRKIQVAHTKKESTAKLETKEVSEVYEILSRHLAKTRGITEPFPSQFTLMADSLNESGEL